MPSFLVNNFSADDAGKVRAPTLVMHSSGDQRVPIEQGRSTAALIPDARFVLLESNNHLILEHEPAAEVFLNEVSAFLGDEKPKSWKRRVHATEAKIETIARRVEASSAFRIIAIIAAVTSVVTFVVWLLR